MTDIFGRPAANWPNQDLGPTTLTVGRTGAGGNAYVRTLPVRVLKRDFLCADKTYFEKNSKTMHIFVSGKLTASIKY
jgi:hypothetical protein